MKRNRMIVCCMLLCAAFAVLLVSTSCDVTTKGDLVPVSLHSVRARSLAYTTDDTAVSYEYKATAALDDHAVGATDWKEIKMVEDEASLGLFSQGIWTFELRGLNSKGTVISYGVTVTKLSTQEENKVNITLGYLQGEGSLSVSVSLDREAYENGTVELWYKPYEKGAFGEKVSVQLDYEEETKTYGLLLDKLPAGNYLIGVVYTAGEDDDSGQVLGIRILDGVRTTIQGTIENGVFYGEDLTITSLRTLKGSIGEKNLELAEDETTLLSWKDKGTVKAVGFSWYMGDELQEGANTSSFSYTQEDIQPHVMTCVAFGPGGEIASASVKISHAKTWLFHEAEETLEGFTYSFNGEKLSVYRDGRFLVALSEGDTQSITDLRAWVSFSREGNTITVLKDETTPIGYFDYK